MSKLSYLLVILLFWLQYSLWLGKNGVLDLMQINNSIKLYKTVNNIDYMKTRNNQLFFEIHELLHGYESIEERSRYDLGMIKSDEVFYNMMQ